MRQKHRETWQDVCVGDRFEHLGYPYEVMYFHGRNAFCRTNDSQYDSWFHLQTIHPLINEYTEKLIQNKKP